MIILNFGFAVHFHLTVWSRASKLFLAIIVMEYHDCNQLVLVITLYSMGVE